MSLTLSAEIYFHIFILILINKTLSAWGLSARDSDTKRSLCGVTEKAGGSDVIRYSWRGVKGPGYKTRAALT